MKKRDKNDEKKNVVDLHKFRTKQISKFKIRDSTEIKGSLSK